MIYLLNCFRHVSITQYTVQHHQPPLTLAIQVLRRMWPCFCFTVTQQYSTGDIATNFNIFWSMVFYYLQITIKYPPKDNKVVKCVINICMRIVDKIIINLKYS